MSASRESDQPIAIQYYRRAFGRWGIQTIHEEHLQKLVNGENVNLEVLNTNPPNPKIFSMRYNDAGRLLLTLREIEGQLTWIVLEDLPTHDYKKARFLRRGVLARFLQINDDAEDNDEEDIQITSRPLNEEEQQLITRLKRDSEATYHPIEFIGGKLAEFNAKQKEALTLGLPIIIDGHAGSGKTFVAEGLLEQYSQQLEDKDIIYLAESEALVEKMRKNWSKRPLKFATDANVKFMTYQQFAAYIDPAIEKLNNEDFLKKEHSELWLKLQWENGGYYKNIQKTLKKGSDNENIFAKFLANKDKLNEEFRIMSGFAFLEQYQKLGEDESLLPCGKQRSWAWAGYQAYLKTFNGKFHRAFSPLTPDKTIVEKIGAIIIDEALDLSCLQINELTKASLKLCFLNGSLQNLQDRISNRSHQEKLIGKIATKIKLSVIKRYSKKIKIVADVVEEIRRLLHGGVSSKKEVIIADVDEQHSVSGEAYWQEDISIDALKTTMARYRRNEFAIVTRPEFKEEAKKIFGDLLIFSFDEVKGLEFPVVMGYRLLDGGNFASANSKLASIDKTKTKSVTSAPKSGEADASYDLECNNLYTAITRTTGDFIFAQESPRHLQQITTMLKRSIKPTQQSEIPRTITPQEITPAEWYKTAISLFDAATQASQVEARKIRDNYLDEEHQCKYDKYIMRDESKEIEVKEKKDDRPAEASVVQQQVVAAPQLTISAAASPQLVAAKKKAPAAKPAAQKAVPQSSKPAKTQIKPKCLLPGKLTPKNLIQYFKSPDAIESLFLPDEKNNYGFFTLLRNPSNNDTFLPILKDMSIEDKRRMLKLAYETEVEVTSPFSGKHALKKIKTEKGRIFSIMCTDKNYYDVLGILINSIDISKEDEQQLLANYLKLELITKIDGVNYISTAFMELCHYESDITFLITIINNIKLVPFLTADHLYKNITSIHTLKSTTPLDCFFRTALIRSKTLFTLLRSNKSLLDSFPENVLFIQRKLNTSNGEQLSNYFTYLLTFEMGTELLLFILKNRTQLLKFITPNLLSQHYPVKPDLKVDKTYDPNYIRMIESPKFDWIMADLFTKNTAFLTELYNKYLINSQFINFLTITIRCRSTQPEGDVPIDLLSQLLEKIDPNLLFKLNEEQLLVTPKEYEDSIFYSLAVNAYYHSYLLMRFVATPQVLDQVNVAELLRYDATFATTPLEAFTTSKEGILLLKLILNNNNDAIKEIKDSYNGEGEYQDDDEEENNFTKIAIDAMPDTNDTREIRKLLGIEITAAIIPPGTLVLMPVEGTGLYGGNGLFELRAMPTQAEDQPTPAMELPIEFIPTT